MTDFTVDLLGADLDDRISILAAMVYNFSESRYPVSIATHGISILTKRYLEFTSGMVIWWDEAYIPHQDTCLIHWEEVINNDRSDGVPI